MMLVGTRMMKLRHQIWLEKQPKHTQVWLKKQAIWHDSDMVKAFLFGAVAGVMVGFLLGLSL